MNILKLGFYEDLGQISDGKKVQRIHRNHFSIGKTCLENVQKSRNISIRESFYTKRSRLF